MTTDSTFAVLLTPPLSTTPSLTSAISNSEINAALIDILQSELFKRAHRMCALLRYLIEKSLHGSSRDMSEYAIGLEVFGRDPSTYCPGDDPVVRVHMGRLRERLKEYYENIRHSPEISFSIPLGKYEPIIERTSKRHELNHYGFLFANLHLYYIAEDFRGRLITKNINIELDKLFIQNFSTNFVPFTVLSNFLVNGEPSVNIVPESVFCYVEGCVVTKGDNLLFKLRIIDFRSQAAMWSQQFSCPINAELGEQENLALEICSAVQQFFERVYH